MVVEIRPNVHYVGVMDWDRRLFDSLIPLPEGTSYNSYIIRGSEKTALIDTVEPMKLQEFLVNLENLGVEKIDYIITNHTEQDHSGSIQAMLLRNPEAKVVTNAKCLQLSKDHLGLDEESFIVVKDGETLSLGDKTLEFIVAPWVHWPETQFTYLKEDKILFSCDFLGSHIATTRVLAEDIKEFYASAKRYFAEIMMPFRNNVIKHLDRLKDYEIEIVGPSHGPIHMNPHLIMDAYRRWSSDDVKNEVLIPWVSMHGSTERMVHHLTDKLVERGIHVKPYNLVVTDPGDVAMALVDAATIVVAASTVLVGPHPAAVNITYLANALRPKTRFLGIIGSYGWGSRMVETLSAMITNLKVEMLPTVIVKGYPDDEALKALEDLADEILKKHKEANLIS
ncbi:MAG: FprA family A-type flavoprotein [bacterium]|jgi:flavorubredoxin